MIRGKWKKEKKEKKEQSISWKKKKNTKNLDKSTPISTLEHHHRIALTPLAFAFSTHETISPLVTIMPHS